MYGVSNKRRVECTKSKYHGFHPEGEACGLCPPPAQPAHKTLLTQLRENYEKLLHKYAWTFQVEVLVKQSDAEMLTDLRNFSGASRANGDPFNDDIKTLLDDYDSDVEYVRTGNRDGVTLAIKIAAAFAYHGLPAAGAHFRGLSERDARRQLELNFLVNKRLKRWPPDLEAELQALLDDANVNDAFNQIIAP